ncbi:MAG: MopE-related protein [Patescibacteria group bacterium]
MAQKTKKLIHLSVLTAIFMIGSIIVRMDEIDQSTGAWAAGNTYYVKTDGSNSNGGTSWDQAWSSINYGANRLSPGDTLLVANGTYNESRITRDMTSGTADNPITIKADGSNVIINSDSHGFWLPGGGSYITIEGFKIYPSGSCILAYYRINGMDGITIKNNSCYGGGISWQEDEQTVDLASGGNTIEGNYLENASIGLSGGVFDTIIRNNYILYHEYGTCRGICVGHGGVDSDKPSASDILITENTIINTQYFPLKHTCTLKKVRNVTFSNNIIYGKRDFYIWGYPDSEHITIDHNTFIDQNEVSVAIAEDSSPHSFNHVTFTNNLFAETSAPWYGGAYLPISELTADYNYYFNPINDGVVFHSLCPHSGGPHHAKCYTLQEWQTATANAGYPQGVHSAEDHSGATIDDLLVNPANYDFTPKNDSWICDPANYGSDGQPRGALPCSGSEPPTCYDNDGDGYGNPASSGCEYPQLDCNDNNDSVWQNRTGYSDNDGDTYYAEDSIQVCSGNSLPAGYQASQGNDCADANPNIHPGATEVCTGNKDDDCDGSVDCDDSDCQNDQNCQTPSGPSGSGGSYEGFGADTPGGVGQTEFHVTTIADSGAGSLRSLLQSGASNRQIVFDVNGTIQLQSRLTISGHHLTIDGTTPSGNPIQIQAASTSLNAALFNVTGNDIIFHNISMNDVRQISGDNSADNFRITGPDAYNIVVDHCTFTRSQDGNLDIIQGAHDVTIQWTIMGDNVKNQLIKNWQAGPPPPYNLTLHHNLYLQGDERNPQIYESALFDMVNNVVYGWAGNYGTYLANGSVGNSIKNYYLVDAGSDGSDAVIIIPDTDNVYMEGNVLPANNQDMGTATSRFTTPLLSSETDAEQALLEVVNGAGSYPRNSTELSLINNILDEFSQCSNNQQIATVCSCGAGLYDSGYCCSGNWQSVPCGQCEEDWQCTDWSECNNNQQARECVDLNECGTYVNQPDLEKDCDSTSPGAVIDLQTN